ncbi:hypothetical protein MB27_13290 [Actinoplanes utahensis]|uniref:Uncharacterized protein n=2 Tax=Actinoplanes utahensis TaxID=1869 RepID=A0A0A6UPU4_ACTUT|nr:hypothetical protein MB27_13290 [Actinoplanes utahensis]
MAAPESGGGVGMTVLERRYRRLLRVYPAGHRAAYEEEMLGVLMSGAEPGRRLPALADVLDLVRAGLTARLGRASLTQRGMGWRDAAAVTALLAAIALAGAAVTTLTSGLVVWARGDRMSAYGVDGLMLADPTARAVIWLLVVTAAVLGLRRMTMVLAAVGVLVQAGVAGFWSGLLPGPALFAAQGIVLAAIVTGLSAAASGRTARAVLGARGLMLLAAATVLAALTRAFDWNAIAPEPLITSPYLPHPMLTEMMGFWLPGLVVAAGVWVTGRGVRGRIVVLSAVLYIILAAVVEVAGSVTVGIHSGFDMSILGQIVLTALLPVMVLAAGVTGLLVWERWTASRSLRRLGATE